MPDSSDILISLHARFVSAMVARSKRVELRTRAPNVKSGCRIWLYSKSPVANVAAVTTLVSVESASPEEIWKKYQNILGLDEAEFRSYTAGRTRVAAIHLGEVQEITPLSLSEMRNIRRNFQPPQFFMRLAQNDPIHLKLLGLLPAEPRSLLRRA